MQDIAVVAWIPIRDTRIDEDAKFHSEAAALDQFLAQVPDALLTLNRSIKSARVSVGKECPAALVEVFQRTGQFSFALHSFAELSADVCVDDEWIRASNPEHEIDAAFIASVATLFVAEAVEKLLLLSELSYPGLVDTTDGVTFVGDNRGQPIKAKRTFSSLRLPESHELAWPPVSSVGFLPVLSWVDSARPFAEGLATTRVQRVMAAFTHIVGLTQYREGEVLFRAMQGLEAFYSEGSGDLRKQLAEKVALWLGRWKSSRNIVGHLYDLRSKFVHGSSPLDYWNNHDEPLEEDEPRLLELSAASSFAVRLLVATIQQCVCVGVADVNWKYAVDVVR